MGEFIERNSYLDIQDKNGNVERHFPITKFKNIEDIPIATKDKASAVKLYDGAGNNEDGAISQKVTTERLMKVQAALQLLALNAYVLDDTTGQVYKIGSDEGTLYFVETEIDPRELADAIVTATEQLAFGSNEEESDENPTE